MPLLIFSDRAEIYLIVSPYFESAFYYDGRPALAIILVFIQPYRSVSGDTLPDIPTVGPDITGIFVDSFYKSARTAAEKENPFP